MREAVSFVFVVVAVIAVLLLAGCADWPALEDYRCTDAQWAEVIAQAEYCQEKGGYTPGYCLAASKASICEPVKGVKK